MLASAIKVGLRIDVDTFHGTRDGVPRLLDILAKHHILATFYFSVGPDNMGRHVWRLLKPAFFLKMMRSNAANLYGWEILLCGTCWPGRSIGYKLSNVIARTRDAGHEVGLHAWDHHKWQAQIEKMSPQKIRLEIQKGFDALDNIMSLRPHSSAAAGWKCTERVLLEKEKFQFRYNSDCRGISIFRPIVGGRTCAPQVPVTLPTYDELIGQGDVTDDNYNDTLFNLIKPDQLNVLTIHAEVEGISKASLFEDFLIRAKHRKVVFVPLHTFVTDIANIPHGTIELRTVPGREGQVCYQTTSENPLSATP